MNLRSARAQVWILVLGALALAASSGAQPPTMFAQERSFNNLKCKGVFDIAMFLRLDHTCDNCHQIYRDPEIYALCRSDCFKTDYFNACLEVLQETDQEARFKMYIDHLNGE